MAAIFSYANALNPSNSDNNYILISKKILHDKSISPTAKGMLAYLLSLPAHWEIDYSGLQFALNVKSECIDEAMQELIKAGYAEVN